MHSLKYTTSSLLIVCISVQLLSPCFSFEGYGTVPHLELVPVIIQLHINYQQPCKPSGVSDLTIGLLELPADSLILNVLEHATHQFFPLLPNGYELVYLHEQGYFMLAINGVAETSECKWTMMTNPPISLLPVHVGPSSAGKSVNDVFVSNYGMEITFTYESVGSSHNYIPVYDLLAGKVPWSVLHPSMDIISNPVGVMYNVEFPIHATCPKPPNFVAGGIMVNITSGQTALNVVESGAFENEPNHGRTFTAKNVQGLYYFIRSINVAATTPSCIWCVKFSPKADGSVPSYPLQVALNDFVIPVEGGMLILEYTTTCNSAQDNLSQGIITDEVRLGSRYLRSSRHCKCKEQGGFAKVAIGHGLSIVFGSLGSLVVLIVGRYKLKIL